MARVRFDGRDALMTRLHEHSGMSSEDIEMFKFFLVAGDYAARFNTSGVLIMPGERYYHKDGTEHTFADVPFGKILREVENRIGRLENLSVEERLHVLDKVLDGIKREKPKWAEPPPNPNEKPATPFSASRAPPGKAKSNAELIDALAKAAGLSKSRAQSIAAQITWWDGMAEGKAHCSITFSSPPRVGGGRLGRDHTLDDVPNHYVRDCIMDWTTTQMSNEDKQLLVRKTVFPDLNDDEIQQYAAAQRAVKAARESEAASPKSSTKSGGESRVLQRLEAALDDISTNLDLTPILYPALAVRDYSRVGPIQRSVVVPGRALPHPLEARLLDDYETPLAESVIGTQVDMCCDQVRSAIAQLIEFNPDGWTIETFRQALGGGVTRGMMVAFLEQWGNRTERRGGKRATLVYQLSWEFFMRRREIGLEVEDGVAELERLVLEMEQEEEEEGEEEKEEDDRVNGEAAEYSEVEENTPVIEEPEEQGEQLQKRSQEKSKHRRDEIGGVGSPEKKRRVTRRSAK